MKRWRIGWRWLFVERDGWVVTVRVGVVELVLEFGTSRAWREYSHMAVAFDLPDVLIIVIDPRRYQS